jgi:hypothetical protein
MLYDLMEFKSFFVVVILYNAETCPMWKIYSVPCNSALNKFYCININNNNNNSKEQLGSLSWYSDGLQAV